MSSSGIREGSFFAVLMAGMLPIVSAATLARAGFCPQAAVVLPTSDAATGDAPYKVQVCDINKDGHADFVTANDASDTLSILLNNGDGTYATKVRWSVDGGDPTVSEPVNVACCDLNGDTFVDLVSVNHTTDDVSVLINDGNNQFPTAVKYTVGEAPFGVACLNLDGDGDVDLVVNGFTEDAVSVLLNNGDGTFAPHTTYAVGDGPLGMTLYDIDGDTNVDVVTANLPGASVTVLHNNADGTLTPASTTDICRSPGDCIHPFDVTCNDLDGMNGPDFATANGIDDSIAVEFNDGAGNFGGLTVYPGVDGADAVTSCDLDGDGDEDVVSANLTSDDLAAFTNDGTGVFNGPQFLQIGVDSTADPSVVVCFDFDDDGDMDLAATFIGGITVFDNNCSGDAVPATSEWSLAVMAALILVAGTWVVRTGRPLSRC